MEKRGTQCSYCYEASITLISTPDRYITRKEKYRHIILMNTYLITIKILKKKSVDKRGKYIEQVRFIPRLVVV